MRRRVIGLLVVFAVVIALAPLLVAKTPLRDALLSAALPGDDLRVTIGEASLGWFSAPTLNRVEVRDEPGNLLLATESVASDQTLLNLLLNNRNLGSIEVVRPSLHVSIRPDGSNLEDAVRSVLSSIAGREEGGARADEAKSKRRYAIRLTDGAIHAEDIAMNRKWRLEGINLAYDARQASGLGVGSLAARLVEPAHGEAAAAPAGEISLSLNAAADGRQELSFQIKGLALGPVEPWLRRYLVAGELSGLLSAQGAASWTPSAATFLDDVATSGILAIDRLDANMPALNSDRLRLARVELPWRIAAQPGRLAIQELEARSDVGRMGIRGTLDTTAISTSQSLTAAVTHTAAQHNLEMRGVLDVARLASLLPKTLRVRDDTTVTSGLVNLAGRLQPAGPEQHIAATLRTAQLAATAAGRPIRWDQPINAELAIVRNEAGLRLETIRCDSEFLQIAANGRPQDFRATADLDLNRLGQQLGQFVDLNGIELAGRGNAEVQWEQNDSNAFTTRAAVSVSALRIASAGQVLWDEPNLELVATAEGMLNPATRRPTSVNAGKLALQAESDEMEAVLTGPVVLAEANRAWPVSIVASGRLASWRNRLRPWVSLNGWEVDGQSEVLANVRVVGDAVELTDTKLSLTNVRATNSSWNIIEQQVQLAGSCRWARASGDLAAKEAQLVTSTVALRVKDLAYRNSVGSDGGAGQSLSGAAAFRCDLARLAAWRKADNEAPEYRSRGELTGNVRFVEQGGRITGEVAANGINLALSQKSATNRGAAAAGYDVVWQEPSASLRSLAAYDRPSDRVEFKSLELQSETIQASAAGTIENVSTDAQISTTGSVSYDLGRVTPLLRPYIGEGIELTGRERARFALAGAIATPVKPKFQVVSLDRKSAIRNPKSEIHWSRRIRGQLELPWSGATIYGLPVGAGRLTATLADGAVRFEPLSLEVGQGQLTMSPYVRLDPPPSEATLPAGPLVTNVRISPEVSEAMLKYVAPVLAGATESDGLFSMQLEGAHVPLGEPRRIDAAGKLTVHSVRVVPGPLAREWINVAQQVEALAKRRDPAALAARPPVRLLSVRDQQVNFRVVDGRVHHQNLEFQVGDVLMRSQGSVGFDETLSLTLLVPIQDAWIAKEPLLAGLKGQSLQVPVAGTLTRPQLDSRAIASVTQQLLQSAAGQAIGNELNKALDKLFKPK